MTYEEKLEVMAKAICSAFRGEDCTACEQSTLSGTMVCRFVSIAAARAAAEAIGLRKIMIKAQNWEDSFKDHGAADFDFDDRIEVHAPSIRSKHD
jgi:hypothetical protein